MRLRCCELRSRRVRAAGRLRWRCDNAIVGAMLIRPNHQQVPDLFANAAATEPAPPETLAAKPRIEPVAQPSPPRHLLPKDLPTALARLENREIDALLAAVIEEA